MIIAFCMRLVWVRVVKMAFASEDFYSEHLKAEDMCVFDTCTFVFALPTGRLDTSVARAHGRLGPGLHEYDIPENMCRWKFRGKM